MSLQEDRVVAWPVQTHLLPTADYDLQETLGSGRWGVVMQCRKVATDETVAVKMLKHNDHAQAAKEEEKILTMLRELGSDRHNIVRCNGSFTFGGRHFFEFEKLDINLREFTLRRPDQALQLKEICPVVRQLAAALAFLRRVGVVHADMKLENIMLVDRARQPLKIKLIDFGLASNDTASLRGVPLQTRWYRAPEVLLGCPVSEAADVWSLGCVAAELFMGAVLFSGADDRDQMRHIASTVGMPPQHMLDAGWHTPNFFMRMFSHGGSSLWILPSFLCFPQTYPSLNNLMRYKVSAEQSLEDVLADACLRSSFVGLIKQTLTVDPAQRITPSWILQHPFVTLSCLQNSFGDSCFLRSCRELMQVCEDRGSGGMEAAARNEDREPPAAGQQIHPAGPIPSPPRDVITIGMRASRPGNKRQRDDVEEEECVSSPDPHPAKRRRRVVAQIRNREHEDFCLTPGSRTPAAKRRRINLDKELADSVQQVLCGSRGDRPDSTQVLPP